jgi:hypothetical protein
MGEGLDVRGGSGGVDAHLDDLDAAGALLRRCAGELAGLIAVLSRMVADPALQLTGVRTPATLAVVNGRAAVAVAGPQGLLTVAGQVTALGTAAGLVAEGYRAADAVVTGAVHEAELAAGGIAGRLAAPALPGAMALASGVVLAGGGAGAGQRLLDLMGEHGTVTEHVLAGVPGFVNGVLLPASLPPAPLLLPGMPLRDVPDTAALVGRLGAVVPGLREPARIAVQLHQGRSVRPPRDLGEITALVASCYPTDRVAGGTATVRVDQVIGPGRRRAWVVAIPGQQEMSLRGGSNPFDLAGDVHAMARRDTAARQSVLAAMRAAGIPPGEPVLLAGHSQGGMVAAGLAADPAVRDRYRVTHVLTVGSPIAEYRLPDDVQMLAVEHTDDTVPRLDGRANPDRSGWVTVQRTVHDPGIPADAAAAHHLDAYRRTVELVDHSADPSLRAYRSGLEPFLDRPGAQGWSNEVSARRVPVDRSPSLLALGEGGLARGIKDRAGSPPR